jgi:RimJ/RimL family protein N-acetyltransferase
VVRLRAPREPDAHAIAEGCSDPEVARWTRVPSPYTLEDARTWIALALTGREAIRELQVVIVREGEDRPVGGVALRLRDDPEPFGDIGYWVAAAHRGRGYGRRAAGLMAEHGLGRLGLRYVEIVASPANEASRRVALGAGFRPAGRELREFKGRMEEFDLFRRPAAD